MELGCAGASTDAWHIVSRSETAFQVLCQFEQTSLCHPWQWLDTMGVGESGLWHGCGERGPWPWWDGAMVGWVCGVWGGDVAGWKSGLAVRDEDVAMVGFTVGSMAGVGCGEW